MIDLLKRSAVDLRTVDLPIYFDYIPRGSRVRTLFPLLSSSAPGRTAEMVQFGRKSQRYISGKSGMYNEAAQINDDATTATFTADLRRRSYFLPWGLQANNQTPVNLAARAMKKLKESQIICEEVEGAANLTSDTWWTNNVGAAHIVNPAIAWNGTDPVPGQNMMTWMHLLSDLSGIMPNYIGMSRDVFAVLRYVLAAMLAPATGRVKPLSLAEMAAYFTDETQNPVTVEVFQHYHDASSEGEDTDWTLTWGTDWLILARVSAKSAGEDEPSFGRTIEKPAETIIDNEVLKDPRGTKFLLDACYVQGVTYPEAGLIAHPLTAAS